MHKFNRDFIKTHTLAECLDEYDCSYQSLRFYCVTHNVRYIKNKKAKQKQYDERMSKFAGLMSDNEASKKLGCSRLTVFYYRVENNIPPFRKHKHTVADNIETILKDYNELGTLQKVADKYGVTRECVRQWFERSGYHYIKNKGYVK